MSTLGQMAELLQKNALIAEYRTGGKHTPNYLSELYKDARAKLRNSYTTGYSYTTLDKNAQIIEQFLNFILSGQAIDPNHSNGLTDYCFDQLLNNSDPRIVRLITNLRKNYGLNGKPNTIAGYGGTIFEDWLNSLIYGSRTGILTASKRQGLIDVNSAKVSSPTTKGKRKAEIKMDVGKVHADIGDMLVEASNIVDETAREQFLEYIEVIAGAAREESERSKEVVLHVQQKIDAGKLVSEINFTAELPPNLQLAIELLAHSTYTLKSRVQGKGGAFQDLKLGSEGASPFRTYSTISTAAGRDGLETTARWLRFIGCIYGGKYKHPHGHADEALKRFYDIRVLYELTGIGQTSNKLKQQIKDFYAQGAQYLIVLYTELQRIRVISTETLLNKIYRILYNNKYESVTASVHDAMYGEIKIKLNLDHLFAELL